MKMPGSEFRYVPAAQTNVVATWKRFGYRPTSELERRARQQRMLGYKERTNRPAEGMTVNQSSQMASGSGRACASRATSP
jgi:hypothetical protein